MFLVRFLENREPTVDPPDKFVSSTPGNFSVPVTMISNVTDAKHVAARPLVFARSVSIAALLKAGKLVKIKVPEKLSLEHIDLQSISWKDFKDVEVFIEKESFAKDASWEAFKATSTSYVNNTGERMVPPNDEIGTLYEKRKLWSTTAILCLPENSCLLIYRELIYMIQKSQL